ncbi:MAG: hypothetical protein CM1200mP27_11980 [Chloroflexota bacterium]|nr:MAG: hypothetical protein CM1200mP27_11980 [Chloroflexota bacterium]
MVRVGAGIRVYEQLETWEKLPEGWVLGQTAIVTDSQEGFTFLIVEITL